MENEVRLTKLAKCAGCGAKVGAGVLAQLLDGIQVHRDPNLLVGFDKSDDASVYKVSDDLALVQTVDFFPPIAEDYRQIRNAMALRGIASGGWGLVRHPAQSLEYILIPLLMNATNVAQDLSVAALTKGLGREGEHTSRTLIRMTVVDWLVMIVVTLPLALDIAGVI